MNLTKVQAKQELQKLVDLFEKEMKSGEAMELNEANTKSTFIKPHLRLLGWDNNCLSSFKNNIKVICEV